MNQLHARISLIVSVLFLSAFSGFAQVTADFNASPTQACPPALIQFTSTSSGNPTSYIWDFGDGTGTSSLQNPSHNYANSGLYTVTLTVSNGSSTDSEIKTDYIRVFVTPQASFTISEDSICSGGSITFTSTSTPGDGAINQYQWNFNDGSSPVTGVSGTTHQFNNGGTTTQSFAPVLVINDVNGCNSSFNDTLWVFPVPTADFYVNQISSCTAPATINFTNTSTNTTLYNWDFGDPGSGANNTSTLVNPSHTYASTGTYTIVLTSGFSGCNDVHSQTITIAQPNANFSASDTVICLYDAVQFTNTGSTGVYSWYFDDAASGMNNYSALQDPTHAFSSPGIHQVRLIVSVGSCSDTLTRTITVRTPPVAQFIAPDRLGCDTPFVVSFSDTVSTHTAWSWNFGDPGSGGLDASTAQSPSHSYHSFGYYSITLMVTDAFGCKDTGYFQNYVQVVQPILDFTRPDSGCTGSTFTFNATVISPSDPTVSTYTWNFGDGTGNQSVTTATTTHTFNTVGIFTVTLSITTSSGCTATLSKPAFIKIGTKPTANFSATPLSICFKQNVQFTDLTAPPVTGWLWNFGDGGSSTSQNPNHQYNIDTSGTADPFDITLISFYNGCPDTFEIQNMITVLGPIPDFSIVYSCTTPYTVSFTNLSGGATSYSWDFGDGSATSSQVNPSHTYPSNSDYPVILTATSTVTGCTVDSTHIVSIRNPQAVATSDVITACYPATVHFIGSGSQDYVSQVWTFGEGIPGVRDTSYTIDTLHYYSRPGYYTATLTLTDIHNCTKVDTQRVHIIGPTAYFYASPFTGCAPLNVTFNDTSHTEGGAINQWIWNYGSTSDTTTSGTANHPYPIPGNYTVTLTVRDVNGCTNSTTATNYIRPTKPVPQISWAADTVCLNAPITITASAGPFVASPVSYHWNFGGNDTLTTLNAQINHAFSANGSYSVQLIATDGNGCVDSIRRNLFVYTTPASFHWVLQDTCVETNGIKQAQIHAVFVSDSNAYLGSTSYTWDIEVNHFDNSGFSSLDYYYAVPPGAYDVALTVVNRFGCMDTMRVQDLVVVPGPTGSFTLSPDSGCRPLTVTLNGIATNSSFYAWDFGDGNVVSSSTEDTVTHTYTTIGDFIPQLYLGFNMPISGAFCYIPVPNADTVKVTSLVSVDILEDTIIVKDGEFDTLHVQVNGPGGLTYTYIWDPAGLVTGDALDPATFYASSSGSTEYYAVNVAYGTSGCSGSDTVLVVYIPCEGSLKIPNVFTPNNDSKNDTYHIDDLCRSEDFYFRIYNRWGKIIYESNDPNFAWDGTDKNGTECSEGTYFYVMHTKRNELHGTIQLIRKKND